MTPKPATRIAVFCTVGILLFLAALAFLPQLFQKRNYAVEMPAIVAGRLDKFPLTKVFELIPPGKPDPHDASKASLKDLFGAKQTLIVNFWATWCPPCLEELPSLEYLNRQLQLKSDPRLPGLVTVSVDEKREAILSLFKHLDFKPSFITLHDKDADLARSVGTVKFPETYWINQDGKILYKWIGPQNWLSEDVLRKLASTSKP